MKIHGKKIDTPNEETVIIPRGDGAPIVFKCGAVLNYEQFEKLYPEPKAPRMQSAAEGTWVEDTDDPDYQAALRERGLLEFNWMVIQSILSTPGLELELIDQKDPATWNDVEKEFREAGFSQVEVNRIIQGVLQANCLDEKRLDEARKSFTLSQAQQPDA